MTGATVTTLKTQRNEKPGAEQGERQRKKESVAGGGVGGEGNRYSLSPWGQQSCKSEAQSWIRLKKSNWPGSGGSGGGVGRGGSLTGRENEYS